MTPPLSRSSSERAADALFTEIDEAYHPRDRRRLSRVTQTIHTRLPHGEFDRARLVIARRGREWVLLGERSRTRGGPPAGRREAPKPAGLTGGRSTATAAAAAREGTAEE
jgi:hypothetical protein